MRSRRFEQYTARLQDSARLHSLPIAETKIYDKPILYMVVPATYYSVLVGRLLLILHTMQSFKYRLHVHHLASSSICSFGQASCALQGIL